MGGHPYWYKVDYQADAGAALSALRKREFEAGRYNPVIRYLTFPIGPESPAPGAAHESIEEAIEAADTDGTRSILDIDSISDEPDFGASCAVSEDELMELFDTTKPTVDQVLNCDEFWDSLERGQARHVVIFDADGSRHLFFVGYSYD
jgi:hypothetical protein